MTMTSTRSATSFARRLGMAVAMLLCSAMASFAWADPPGRVGRVGELNGQVWMYTPDAGEWVAAERNRPLTGGDRLATDNDARAELRIGSASVRLDAGTELEVVAIDDEHVALQLHGGSVATQLQDAESAHEFELRTAEGRFVVHRPGRYRFDRTDASSYVTVWSGEAAYEGDGTALTVQAGQRAEFWLENNAAQYALSDPVRDGFAAWSEQRDRGDERTVAQQYVSPEMTGVEDLDRYGQWQQTPDYGAVWFPQVVPVGWAPYRTGHWVWVSPWGWTWVDDMPWGFAPYHYGRWAYVGTRWCWVPGSYVRHPVYAPALVGWVGGPHANVSVTIGNRAAPAVGWFPLAPREVYVPSYRVSPHYVEQVNFAHVPRIGNVTTIVDNPQGAVSQYDYANRKHHHALTVVPQDVMANRQPVAPVAARMATTPAMQQLFAQSQQAALSAAPVAAPAQVEQRRMHVPGGEGRPAAVAAIPPAPVGTIPAAPQGRFVERGMRGAPGTAPGAPGTPGARAPATAAAPAAPARAQALAAPQAPVGVPAPPRRGVPPPPVTQAPAGVAQSPEARNHEYRGRGREGGRPPAGEANAARMPPSPARPLAPLPPAQLHQAPPAPVRLAPQAPVRAQPAPQQQMQAQPQGHGRAEARGPGRESHGRGPEQREAHNEQRQQPPRERAN
jgi:hypothetical protein